MKGIQDLWLKEKKEQKRRAVSVIERGTKFLELRWSDKMAQGSEDMRQFKLTF